MSNMNENLKAYIDGELSGDQAREVEQQLQTDATLRSEFDEMRRISSTLREASVSPAVSGLEGTLSALAKNQRAVRPRFLRLAPALGLIGTCALALVIVGRLNSNDLAKYNDEFPMPGSKKDIASQPAQTLSTGSPASAPAPQEQKMYKDVGVAAGTDYLAKPRLGEERVSNGMTWSTDGLSLGSDAKARNERVGELERSKGAFQQQIVKTGDIGLSVKSGAEAIDKVKNVAVQSGGYVESSNQNGDAETGFNGQVTMRVPVARFDEAMGKLQKLGKVTGISSSGADVTSTVVGNDAQLRSLSGQELSYQKILDGARRVPDVMTVKEKLDEVQQNIATIQASQVLLKKQATMSTINVAITQPAPKKPVLAGTVKDDWMSKTWSGAWLTLSAAGKKITGALIYLIVFCPVWIPMVVLANMATRRLRQVA